jgi:FkbM family methyltransferase
MKFHLILLFDLIKAFRFFSGTKFFLSLLFFGKEKVSIPGIERPVFLRRNTSDFRTFLQVFVEKGYDIPKMENVAVILDAGANIGLFSVLMKSKFPSAKVICIEPDIDNYAQLKKNLQAYTDVYYENIGIWNKSAYLKISDKYDMGKWGMVVEETNAAKGLEAHSIEFIMRKYGLDRIDILKIDIETSEKILFKDNYEYWLPKAKMIIIETHDWIEKGTAQPFFTAINKVLSKYSYYVKGDNTIVINEGLA